MQSKPKLFRRAAVAARAQSPCGAIVLWQPLPLRIGAALACCVAAGIAALLVLGSYTRHDTLRGWLTPDGGLIGVSAPQRGTVLARMAAEGDAVAAGAPLFVLSSERVSTAGATHEEVGARLKAQQLALAVQREQLTARQSVERDALARQRTAVDGELASIEAMIGAQTERMQLAAAAAERYARAQAEGFVPLDEAAARRALVLEHVSRLRALERELSAKRGEATELAGRARSLDMRYTSEAAELERSIVGTEAQRIENEAQRQVTVVAPRAGIVSAALVQEGQVVETGGPLAFIVPEGALLHAELYAPSRVVGFVAPGDEVLLRFPAFPYQKFGHHRGTVASVSGNGLIGAELPRRGDVASRGEAVYRVVVKLEQQTVAAYGDRYPLVADMAVEADVLQDRRTLLEWMFDPVYALTGKLH